MLQRYTLTAEIQIDRCGHFTHFIFGFNLIKTSILLNHVLQLEDYRVRIGGYRLDFHHGPVVFGQLGLASKPRDFRLGTSQQTAFKYQPVAVVLLSQLWLLRETGSKIFGHTHYGSCRFAVAAAQRERIITRCLSFLQTYSTRRLNSSVTSSSFLYGEFCASNNFLRKTRNTDQRQLVMIYRLGI